MSFIFPFLISALMGMGIGGGGLYIIYLCELLEINNTVARGTNLVFFIISALSALILHVRKRKIYPVQVIVMVIFGILGSYIFSHISNEIDPQIPKKVLGSVLILGAVVSFLSEGIRLIKPSKK